MQTFVDRFVERFFNAPSEGFTAANTEAAPAAYHVLGVHMRSGMAENSQDVRVRGEETTRLTMTPNLFGVSPPVACRTSCTLLTA